MFEQIDCARARQLVSAGAQLLDVRTPGEFAQWAIPGSTNLPLHHLHHAEAYLQPGTPVVVYCRSGARSAQARVQLNAMGYEAYDLGSVNRYFECQQA